MSYELITYNSFMSASWVHLPRPEDRFDLGPWAWGAAEELFAMYGKRPRRKVRNQLVGQLAGWANVARVDMPMFNQTFALTDVPPERVDAMGYLTSAQLDEELSGVDDVERLNFEVFATERLTPRTYDPVDVEFGPGVKTFSLRRSSFNGEDADVRHVEYFLFPRAYPDKFVVLGVYWPLPEHDEFIFAELERMVESLTMQVD